VRRGRQVQSDIDASLQTLVAMLRDVDQKLDSLSHDARAVFNYISASRIAREAGRKKP